MTSHTILSDLCKICNNNTPKYCCPRCSCLTCSLPCYKRHQTWSQCSGKRDPAAYLKRSQLATPAGIDHDYNFLTGIERAFDNADRDAEHRGIDLGPNVGKNTGGLRRLQSRIREAKVSIKKAPKGMSRQKENHTHCHKVSGHDSLSWTVEWILPNGSRRLRNCGEHESIQDAYDSLSKDKQKSKSKKRKLSGNKHHQSHDGGSQEVATLQPRNDTLLEHNVGSQYSPASPTNVTGNLQLMQSDLAAVPEPPTDSSTWNTSDQETAATETSEAATDHRVPTDNASDPGGQASGSKVEPHHQTTYFYLHRPLSTSSRRILIPLSATATLHDSLQNRTVLEFPTIHVLHEGADSLPADMQLEHDYLQRTKQMVEELDEELAAEGYSLLEPEHALRESDAPGFDETKVLETLKKDVAAVGSADATG